MNTIDGLTNAPNLDGLFTPHTVDDFLTKHLSREVLRTEGARDRFRTLVSWEEINAMLSRGGHNVSRMRLTMGGDQPIPQEAYSRVGIAGYAHLQMGRVADLLRQGAVAHIDSAEQTFEGVAAVADRLEKRLETPVTACVRASWSDAAAPHIRRYDHDAIVLRVNGNSVWRIHEPTPHAPALLRARDENANGAVRTSWREIPVESGNVLYLPKGWLHAEHSMNQSLLTVELWYRNPTGLDIVERIVDQLRLVEVMKKDCPRFADAATQSKYFTTIQQELLKSCTAPGMWCGYFRDLRAMSDPVKALGLQWGAAPDIRSISAETIPVSLVRYSDSLVHSSESNDVEVFFDGQVLSLDPVANGLLLTLCEHPGKSIRNLIAEDEDRNHSDSTHDATGRILEATEKLYKLGLIIYRDQSGEEAPSREASELVRVCKSAEQNASAVTQRIAH